MRALCMLCGLVCVLYAWPGQLDDVSGHAPVQEPAGCPLLHRKPPTRPHSALARSPSSLVWLQSLARSSVCVCMFAAEEGSGAASPLCGCAGRCRPNQLPPAPRTHPQGKFAAAAMQRHAEPTIRACRSCTTGSHAATGTQLFVCLFRFVCFGLSSSCSRAMTSS